MSKAVGYFLINDGYRKAQTSVHGAVTGQLVLEWATVIEPGSSVAALASASVHVSSSSAELLPTSLYEGL